MTAVRQIKSAAEVPSQRLARIFDYWAGRANERECFAPQRSDIRPQDLRGDLPWIWLSGYSAEDGSFGFRLAGDELKNFLGLDSSAKSLAECPRNRFFVNVENVFSQCVRSRTPLLVGPVRTTLEAKSFKTIAVLVLPLSENGADVSALFGGFEHW
jgi:hypothetical protein